MSRESQGRARNEFAFSIVLVDEDAPAFDGFAASQLGNQIKTLLRFRNNVSATGRGE